MRREHNIGLFGLDRGNDLLDWSRNKRRLGGFALEACFQYRRRGRNVAHLENL